MDQLLKPQLEFYDRYRKSQRAEMERAAAELQKQKLLLQKKPAFETKFSTPTLKEENEEVDDEEEEAAAANDDSLNLCAKTQVDATSGEVALDSHRDGEPNATGSGCSKRSPTIPCKH